MLAKTGIQVPKTLIEQALEALPSDEFRHTINKPAGDFFYDPWEIKDEYRGTVWDNLLSYLPSTVGEARVILLDHSKCYQIHADIDDRYHLNLAGTNAFLVDLEYNKMYPLEQDGHWYAMDAGVVHSAVNFGRTVRVQLVVRHLLKNATLKDPVSVKITFNNLTPEHARFVFDSKLSPVLNLANKSNSMNSFAWTPTYVSFNMERDMLEYVKTKLPENFKIL
jgi:hypothetical protein